MARRHPFVSAPPPADLYAIKGWTAAAAAAAADDTLFKISHKSTLTGKWR